MSIRYLIERKYDFSPVLLSNGNKIAININETGNSCKVIYDPAAKKSGCSCEVIDSKYPNFIKITNDDQMNSPLMTKHEENQVLKRRHYFDNTTTESVPPLIKGNDKKYAANSCWELKAKTHSVQELSDKFEIYKDIYSNQGSFKSWSRLMERKLTFLLSGRNNKKYNLQNGVWKKSQCPEYPFRNQPIGINRSYNSLNLKTLPSSMKFWNYRTIDHVPEKRANESISKFSSTICIPITNPRLCYSSINLSGPEYKMANGLRKNKEENTTDTFGSTKSMESLFINSQMTETVDIPFEKETKENVTDQTPNLAQDMSDKSSFHENIIKIKSLLKPVERNGSLKYKSVHRLKKKSNSFLDKKIKFFENLTNSSRNNEEESLSSLPSRGTSTIDFGYSTISLNDI